MEFVTTVIQLAKLVAAQVLTNVLTHVPTQNALHVMTVQTDLLAMIVDLMA